MKLQLYCPVFLHTNCFLQLMLTHFDSSTWFNFLYSLPLFIASLNSLQYSSTAHGVSSFPGTGYVTRLGLQFVSTMPTVGMHILAQSLTAVCCVRIVVSVFKNMHRSGNRVTAPKCISALVSMPPLQYLVWANSWHSSAVHSTRCAFWAPRAMKRIMPSLAAMWAVKLSAWRKWYAVISKSKIKWPRRDPKMNGFIRSSRDPSRWPRCTRASNRSRTVNNSWTLKKSGCCMGSRCGFTAPEDVH